MAAKSRNVATSTVLRRQNRDYLKGLVAQLKEIPRQVAMETGHNLLLKVISYTAIDTGQAAANWRIAPFTRSPKFDKQEIMWGDSPDYTNPIYPVVSKQAFERNNLGALIEFGNTVAAYAKNVAMQSTPGAFSGVVVYNPITPGFANFHPDSDWLYEKNALSEAESKWQSAYDEAVAEAETEMKLKFSALR